MIPARVLPILTIILVLNSLTPILASAADVKQKSAKKAPKDILTPLDPSERAGRAMKGFLSRLPRRVADPQDCYRPVFGCALLPRVHIAYDGGMMARWECGDLNARAILAWIAAREMTSDMTTGREIEEGQRRFLLAILHPKTGLAFVPELSNREKGRYHYHSWDQSRALRALVRWYETEPTQRERLRPLIERIIHSLDDFCDIRGHDETWGPYACWSADEFDQNHKPVPHPFDRNAFPNVGELIPDPAGSCIEPLAMYAELTDDPKATDLAIRFTNGEFGRHRSDKFPPDQKKFSGFAPDGSFAGHFHSKTTTLIGIVKLAHYLGRHGRLAEARRYLHQVRKSYDWIFAADNPSRGSRIGWFLERPRAGGAEMCCTADMIELAAAMAACASLHKEFRDWSALHDDVESMTVNMIARSQIRMTPEFESFLSARYGADASGQITTARNLDGTWPTCPPPNDLFAGNSLPLSGCCQYAGVRALYTGWLDAMIWEDGHLRINFPLNCQSPQAVMTTEMPFRGEAKITLRKNAYVLVRVPAWLEPGKITLTVNGHDIKAVDTPDNTQHYITLGKLAQGTEIRARFPLEERVTEEQLLGARYKISWRGNYVVSIDPPGRNYPLFP